jgi:hypothetical protein
LEGFEAKLAIEPLSFFVAMSTSCVSKRLFSSANYQITPCF